MSKIISTIVIILVVIALGLGFWFYQSNLALQEVIESETTCEDGVDCVVSGEEACLNSGGQVTISQCCKSTEDYPNLCPIGPCGCSPDNSQETKICDCGEGKCFDGKECVAFSL